MNDKPSEPQKKPKVDDDSTMADDMLEGIYCQHCGELMLEDGDTAPGYPQTCAGCLEEGDDDEDEDTDEDEEMDDEEDEEDDAEDEDTDQEEG